MHSSTHYHSKSTCKNGSYQLVKLNDNHWTLPLEQESWFEGRKKAIRQRNGGMDKTRTDIKQFLNQYSLQWPEADVVFISDLHADSEALVVSLLATGHVELCCDKELKFKLKKHAKHIMFIFGGDFFDKGPSNLRLLSVLKNFADTGAKIRILAGNHDIRVLFGMLVVGHMGDTRNAHFFARMGAKAIPFLQEIDSQYFDKSVDHKDLLSDEESLEHLLPGDEWWRAFPKQAADVLSPTALNRELDKIKQKSERFVKECEKAGLTPARALRAAKKWQQLFVHRDGEYNWFFKKMRLAAKRGSFLFVHAGLDDKAAKILHDFGVAKINRLFRKQLRNEPFEFYYGEIANVIRTKYRVVDKPLSKLGAKLMHETGIHVIVHGHRNLHHGQRIAMRKSIMHFECDVTMDHGSRKKEGLKGRGGGATLIEASQRVRGISTDYPKIKSFEPAELLT